MAILQNNVEAIAGNPPVYVDRLYTIVDRDLSGITSYDLSVHPLKSDNTDSFTHSSYNVQPLDTVENIRDNLVNIINNNLSSMDTKYINIEKVGTNQIRCYGFINGSGLGPSPFLDNGYVTVDINSNFYNLGTSGTPAQQQKIGYTLSGTVEAGDKYTVGNVTYTVQSTDTNIENIVDKLILGLNGGTATGLSGTSSLSGVTASKDSNGMLILTANVAGIPFTPPIYQVTNASINNQNITLVNTINNVTSGNENKYSISGFINEGNSYNIGGAIYTAQAGDTIEDVIDGLVNAVNGNSVTGVSGNSITGVVAIKTPPPIQISIKPSTNFTISATTNLSNLTANELKNDLSINSNNVVIFNSSNGKYSTYAEDSTIHYNDETQNIDTQNLQSVNSLSGLKNLNYLTVDIAQRYMTIVDDNLTALNNFRGSFGSAQNQLESVSRNLMTQYTNLKNAESVIRDVDYAEESTNFNKLNIIGQGAIYAQAKANERKQDIIQLLQQK